MSQQLQRTATGDEGNKLEESEALPKCGVWSDKEDNIC